MLRSELFAGDALLEAIAADRDRISRFRHPTDPAVRKLQTVRRLDAMLPAAGPAPAIDPALREALHAILGDPTSPSVAVLTSELARRGVTRTADDLAAVMARLLAA